MAMYDASTQLIPPGVIASTQNFPGLQVEPRFLPSCALVINVVTPPAAAATFALEVATTLGGVYTRIGSVGWPAGVSGSKTVTVGAGGGNAAWLANNTAAFVRAAVTVTGPLTMGPCGAYLTKASDGGAGLGSRSYTRDGLNQL
jgi:hypothetical protein